MVSKELVAAGVEMAKAHGVSDSDAEFKVACMMVRGLMEAGVPAQKAMDAVMGEGFYEHFTKMVAAV